MEINHKYYEQAAGSYLCEPLPSKAEWEDMNEDEAFAWLEENAWEPLEFSSGKWLWENIEVKARSLQTEAATKNTNLTRHLDSFIKQKISDQGHFDYLLDELYDWISEGVEKFEGSY